MGTDTTSETNPATESKTTTTTHTRPQSGCSGAFTSHNCASPEVSAVAISNVTAGGLPQNEQDCVDRCGLATRAKGWLSNACCRWYPSGKALADGTGCLLYPGASKETGESMFVKSAAMACH